MTERSAHRAALDRRLQIVAGKGGVGRTTLACALALRSARAGHRTLLLEVNAPDSAARVLGVDPSVDEPRKVGENLWLCRMTPAGAMREYALMVLRFKALYHLVFENRLVKYLLRSIPSLAEFTMLGKAWYHTTERDKRGDPLYERVIIDAPATGHALTFLSVARVVADTVPDGVMKNAAERMAQLLENEQETAVHVVALPEEMAVNEGLDLIQALRTRLRMYPGIGFLNRVLPPLLNESERVVFDALPRGGPIEPYRHATARRLGWEALQRTFGTRFAHESGLPTIVIPQIERGEGGPPLERLEAVIEELASLEEIR